MKTNSIFKKVMIFSMIGLCTMNVMPRKSNAIVGLCTGAVPMMIVGGGMMVAGFFSTDYLLNNLQGAGVLTFIGMIAGFVLLDDQHQISPRFTALDANAALALNIDPNTELSAYNEALPTINAINQTINTETNQYNQPNISMTELSNFVQQEWATYGQYLSPQAYSALKKVQANLSSTVNAAVASTSNN